MDSGDEINKMLEESLKGMEYLFAGHPESAKAYKEMLKQQFMEYAGEGKIDNLSLKEQKTTSDENNLRKVTREQFPECIPLSDRKVMIEFSRQYSHEEYRRMTYCLAPKSMDEKWVMLLEDETLRMFRSWPPQNCIFEIIFEKGGEVFKIRKAWVDRTFLEEPWNSPPYTTQLIEYLIERMLLGHYLAFPFPNTISDPMQKALFRHGLVGSSLANDEG